MPYIGGQKPVEVGGVGDPVALSLTKAAHVAISRLAWQEIRGTLRRDLRFLFEAQTNTPSIVSTKEAKS